MIIVVLVCAESFSSPSSHYQASTGLYHHHLHHHHHHHTATLSSYRDHLIILYRDPLITPRPSHHTATLSSYRYTLSFYRDPLLTPRPSNHTATLSPPRFLLSSPLLLYPSNACFQVNGLGSINEGALVMEYLDGTEYVVDSVSRDGSHRICAIWEYDKRRVNGANFVYFGMELRPATGPVSKEMWEDAVLL